MESREPTEQLDPPTAAVIPPDAAGDDQPASEANGDSLAWADGFGLACPVCGQRLSGFANYCPHCEAHLPFGGTFSPGKTVVAKALSWILLVVFIGSMVTLVGLIIRQMI